MITIVCYNRKETWESRENAIEFYGTGMVSCDCNSSEYSRYQQIYTQLISGWTYCCDDYVCRQSEAKEICDSCTEMNPKNEKERIASL